MARHRSAASPLAVAYAALILYASLYPFADWRWPPGQAAAGLLLLPWPPWLDVFDLWSNFLGYVPLGLLVVIAARRSGWRLGAALGLAVLAPCVLSYSAEFTQNFLPGRHPSLKDWVTNSLGAAAGAALGAALQTTGLLDAWHGLRERWFVRRSAGALALLTLWPVGLLFPTPAPFGLGQVGSRLRLLLVDLLDGVPWAAPLHVALATIPAQHAAMDPLAEAATTVLGLLAPCLLAYAVMWPGWQRILMTFGALLLAIGALTLSTALNFGPPHALAWMTSLTGPAFGAALIVATLVAPLRPRLIVGVALVALTALVVLVAQAPSDPYFAQSLQSWEQGRFVRFHGLAQWVGWLWPYGAMAWLMMQLGKERPA